MKYLSRKPAALVFGALVLPLIGGATFLSAGPAAHADSSSDRRRDDDGPARRVSGVVTSVTDRRFEVRTDQNQTVVVRNRDAQPRGLSVGDRVDVSGQTVVFNGQSILVADSVRITSQGGSGHGGNWGGNGQSIEFSGSIVEFQTNNRMAVRRDGDNQTYVVTSRSDLRRTYNAGDRVKVSGTLSGRDTVSSNNIDRLAGGPNGGWNGNGGGHNGGSSGNDYSKGRVDFRGTLSRVRSGRQIEVRGNDNETYVVNLDDSIDPGLNVGDRVRITGRDSGNSTINSGQVSRSGRGNEGNGSVGRGDVDFRGRVSGNEPGGVLVKGDDGRTYRVKYGSSLTPGLRIRVRGYSSNGVITATDIDRL